MNAAAEALVGQLRSAVGDERILAAIGAMPRERFVPAEQREHAYENVALPIGEGQTISQPLVVARMLELLDPRATDRVLDVGTGSGYHAALLARLSAHVWTVERHPELSERARAAVAEIGIANITFLIGDGTDGLAPAAPFDAINVAASSDTVPAALVAQLAPGGRLVMPQGGEQQRLIRLLRATTGVTREEHESVRFVPLIRTGASASPPPRPDWSR